VILWQANKTWTKSVEAWLGQKCFKARSHHHELNRSVLTVRIHKPCRRVSKMTPVFAGRSWTCVVWTERPCWQKALHDSALSTVTLTVNTCRGDGPGVQSDTRLDGVNRVDLFRHTKFRGEGWINSYLNSDGSPSWICRSSKFNCL